jgi:putative membrane protein
MDRLKALFSGSSAFALYFGAALVLLVAFVALYNWLTPYSEMALIRKGNRSAALALGGAIVGFVIPVGKAVEQSSSLADMIVWAAIAFVAQLAAYAAGALLVPHFRRTIAEDHLASGILLAALAVAIGILNAASMTS